MSDVVITEEQWAELLDETNRNRDWGDGVPLGGSTTSRSAGARDTGPTARKSGRQPKRSRILEDSAETAPKAAKKKRQTSEVPTEVQNSPVPVPIPIPAAPATLAPVAPPQQKPSRKKDKPKATDAQINDEDDDLEEPEEEREPDLPENQQNPLGVGGEEEAEEPEINIIWAEYDVRPTPQASFRKGIKTLNTLPNFKARGVGPRNIPAGLSGPFDFEKQLFDDSILQDFITATEGYAASTNDDCFKQTKTGEDRSLSLPEMRYYFAIVQFMGVCKLPSREDYWANGIYMQSFVDLMSLKRFEDITRNLHYVNTAQFTESQKAAKRQQDPFWQVEDFMKKLEKNFKKYFKPNQFFDIDEMCIYFKGRHICRCYNPNKPEKWHFKVYCLNDAQTGYLWGFFLYRGKREQRAPGVSATAWPVFKLTADEELHNLGYILCLDNWFNSIPVLVELKSNRGIDVDGTCRSNRKGMPKLGQNGLISKAEAKRPGALGMIRALEGTFQHTKMYLTSWADNKPVYVLSTFPTYSERVFRKTKDPETGAFMKIQIERPLAVGIYNRGMGGTDLGDALVSYYRTRLRMKTWPARILFHMKQVQSVNSCILFNEQKRKANSKHKRMPLKEFLTEIFEDAKEEYRLFLKAREKKGKAAISSSSLTQYIKKVTYHRDVMQRLTGDHNPILCRSQKRPGDDAQRTRNTKRCVYSFCPSQETRPNTFCAECDVPLHCEVVGSGGHMSTCWYRFHHSQEGEL